MEQWHLPKKFTPTETALAENDDHQKQFAKVIPFKKQSPQEILISNARIRINEILQIIDGENTEYLRRVLAENYAVIGNFERAAEFEPNDSMALNYKKIAETLKSENTRICGCLAPENLQSNITVLQEIPFQTGFVKLLKCMICKEYFIRK